MEAYPTARSFACKGLSAKRQDLQFSDELGPSYDKDFGSELLRLPIEGMPKLNESMFYHHASQTLIAVDFCFFMPEATGFTGLFATLMGIKKKVRCEPLFKLMIRDKAAFRTSLIPLRSLTIQHLSMCHDRVISEGAHEAIHEILESLKVPKPLLTDSALKPHAVDS